MKLTIILTSYGRPKLVARTVESILNQSDPRWRLIVQDDGSGMSVLGPLRKFAYNDHRIELHEHPDVTDRDKVSRYAVLINEALPWVEDGSILGYLCDNVEYKPDLVERVLRWFEVSQDRHIGYVAQGRDVYQNGRFESAAIHGHWATVPQFPGATIIPQYIRGNLDHSQVFHRFPMKQRWSEDIKHVKYGDAEFYTRLAYELGDIECIWPLPLTWEHIPG